MEKCLLCLRFLKAKITRRKQRPWLQFIYQHCQKNINTFGWCQIVLQNYNFLSQYSNQQNQNSYQFHQKVIRQMRQTNISSEILKIIAKDVKGQNSQFYERQNNNQNLQNLRFYKDQYQSQHFYQKKQSSQGSLSNSSSPFQFCIDLFTSYIKLKYSQIINPSRYTLTKVQNQFHDFIQTIKKSMIQYYDLQGRQLIGQDFYQISLNSFLIDLVFKNQADGQQFNNVILKLQRECQKTKNDRINFNIQKFKSLGIQQYGVNQVFRLNFEQNQQENLNKSPVLKNKLKPYSVPIQLVKEIIRCKAPHQKLKNLQQILKQIQVSINNFYTNNRLSNTQQKNNYTISQQISNKKLDPLNLQGILTYAIVQSGQNSLLSHLNLTKNYLNRNYRLRSSFMNNNNISTLDYLKIIQKFQKSLQNIQKGVINITNVYNQIQKDDEKQHKMKQQDNKSLNLFNTQSSSFEGNKYSYFEQDTNFNLNSNNDL